MALMRATHLRPANVAVGHEIDSGAEAVVIRCKEEDGRRYSSGRPNWPGGVSWGNMALGRSAAFLIANFPSGPVHGELPNLAECGGF
jgi:hypothetical protein